MNNFERKPTFELKEFAAHSSKNSSKMNINTLYKFSSHPKFNAISQNENFQPKSSIFTRNLPFKRLIGLFSRENYHVIC